MELVRKEGKRIVKRSVEFYNLDAIISVGFRVNTKRGIEFRQWANNVLKQYLIKGYVVNKRITDLESRVSQQEGDNHDRFLIIDDDVYLFGASLKDAGKRLFAYIKMQDTTKAEVLSLMQ